ncbi:hypothetical protein SMAX5B_002244 [Scophthalmus maximus]|uniref:C2H2-type domain-containing protein n=1 Tax=Scophthalmus maximus TaxID=52904 RepID=A0A2U9BGG4_SCOMX|nr:hypothetical protein SMAX5B_002244 [Scophthalmus maximus]
MGKSIIIKNIAPDSTVDGILDILSPYTKVSAGDVSLIKDKQTGWNRGFAYVKLSSVSSGLVVANNRDSDPEEDSSYRAADEEGKGTDWTKVDCLLCRRRFPTKEALQRHTRLSDLHKQNVEIQRRSTLLKAELEELERKGTELNNSLQGSKTKHSNGQLHEQPGVYVSVHIKSVHSRCRRFVVHPMDPQMINQAAGRGMKFYELRVKPKPNNNIEL